MQSALNFLAQIASRLCKIEQRLDDMDRRYERVLMMFEADARNDRILLSQIRTDATDIYDRIKTLELNVFPGLPDAIGKVSDIIGDAPENGYNPLDHRGHIKPNAKKT